MGNLVSAFAQLMLSLSSRAAQRVAGLNMRTNSVGQDIRAYVFSVIVLALLCIFLFLLVVAAGAVPIREGGAWLVLGAYGLFSVALFLFWMVTAIVIAAADIFITDPAHRRPGLINFDVTRTWLGWGVVVSVFVLFLATLLTIAKISGAGGGVVYVPLAFIGTILGIVGKKWSWKWLEYFGWSVAGVFLFATLFPTQAEDIYGNSRSAGRFLLYAAASLALAIAMEKKWKMKGFLLKAVYTFFVVFLILAGMAKLFPKVLDQILWWTEGKGWVEVVMTPPLNPTEGGGLRTFSAKVGEDTFWNSRSICKEGVPMEITSLGPIPYNGKVWIWSQGWSEWRRMEEVQLPIQTYRLFTRLEAPIQTPDGPRDQTEFSVEATCPQ